MSIGETGVVKVAGSIMPGTTHNIMALRPLTIIPIEVTNKDAVIDLEEVWSLQLGDNLSLKQQMTQLQ